MGTTWRDRATATDDSKDLRTVTTFGDQADIDLRDRNRADIDLRDPPPSRNRSADQTMAEVLVRIAAAGIEEETALVFMRRWSRLTSDSSARSAAALASASASLRGSVNPRLLLIVDRWIEALAPLGEQLRAEHVAPPSTSAENEAARHQRWARLFQRR